MQAVALTGLECWVFEDWPARTGTALDLWPIDVGILDRA
jgi:hypothetical protein